MLGSAASKRFKIALGAYTNQVNLVFQWSTSDSTSLVSAIDILCWLGDLGYAFGCWN